MIDTQESITAKLCSFARAYHFNYGKEKIFDDCLAYDMMGEIPGSKRIECVNYPKHKLGGARKTAVDMLSVLENRSVTKFEYQK